jgi:hypothetical protein
MTNRWHDVWDVVILAFLLGSLCGVLVEALLLRP